MTLTTLAVMLAKQLGPPMAHQVLKALGRSGNAPRMERALELTKSGLSAVTVLRTAFGDDFDKAVSVAAGTGKSGWSYQAGRGEYVRLEANGSEKHQLLSMLKDELNINLDRIHRLSAQEKDHAKNYFRGVMAEWQARYTTSIGGHTDSNDTFASIEKLLDDTRKTFATAVRVMARTGLGSVGAVLVVYGVLVGTATGMGVLATISAWLVGLPLGAAAFAVVPGVIMLALAMISFKDKDALSVVVQMTYKLIDRQLAALSSDINLESSVPTEHAVRGPKKVAPAKRRT